jgi:general secretion pathway protein H
MGSPAETASMPIFAARFKGRSRAQSAGFSLIELLIVIMIGAGLAAMAGVAFAGRQEAARFRTHLVEIEQFLTQARSTAMLANQEVIIAYDKSAAAIVAKGWSGAKVIRPDMTMTIRGGEDSAAIRFYPSGSSSGGAIALAMGAQAARIEVDWLTGRITRSSEPVDAR